MPKPVAMENYVNEIKKVNKRLTLTKFFSKFATLTLYLNYQMSIKEGNSAS